MCVQVDLSFSHSEPLQQLPRLVYALLRSPLLAPAAEGQHPDLTTFLAHLWACLPPSELVRAIYPVLCSYHDPETMVGAGGEGWGGGAGIYPVLCSYHDPEPMVQGERVCMGGGICPELCCCHDPKTMVGAGGVEAVLQLLVATPEFGPILPPAPLPQQALLNPIPRYYHQPPTHSRPS